MVGLTAAVMALSCLHVPGMPHLRAINPHVAPSLEAAAKGGSPQTAVARVGGPVSDRTIDSRLTAGISSFAFQVCSSVTNGGLQ